MVYEQPFPFNVNTVNLEALAKYIEDGPDADSLAVSDAIAAWLEAPTVKNLQYYDGAGVAAILIRMLSPEQMQKFLKRFTELRENT